jgi:hypothetical protein
VNRKLVVCVLTVLGCTALGLSTGCGSSGLSPSQSTTIAATSGSGQTATVGKPFAAPLVVTVMSASTPLSGVSVTFTASGAGASGTFANGSATETDTTNTSGVATSSTFTANATAGTYGVIASITGTIASITFSLTNAALPGPTVTAISGSGQKAAVSTAFAAPLVASVTLNGNRVGGASVTFTAPGSGASGTFANGTTTETDVTNSSGLATSSTFTANATAGAYNITASTTGASSPAAFSLTNNGPTISATSGSGQSAVIGKPFAAPLVATVLDGNSNPISGATVTFVAPASGAGGTFMNGTATETDTTNSSGVATSSTFTANSTVGGPYTVAATAPGTSTPANFSLTNSPFAFAFSLSGQEAIKNGPNFYALAGAITFDANGNVIGGVQDYNDGVGNISSPNGDPILSGSLSVSPTTGQGTLTLNTNNTNVGVNGIETLGVQFVNSSHALILQFDGTATSSGTMDAQTLVAPSGSYAFTLSGADSSAHPLGMGGVFTVNGTLTGVADVNDDGTVNQGQPLSATVGPADRYGRGQITGVNVPGFTPMISYYIVGAETFRMIDVNVSDSAIGSAFGQGTTTFDNTSLGSSVFGVASNVYPAFGASGQFSTAVTPTTANFAGVGDDNEPQIGNSAGPAAAISGTYSISNTVGSVTYNGYGSLTIGAGFGDVSALGIYMVDPNLNLNDPNNATGGGGALLLDLDGVLPSGTGFVVPQIDSATTSFTGNYAAGWQDYNAFSGCVGCEFDMVAQGSMTAGGALSLTGLVSDPFSTLGTPDLTSFGNTFTGTPLADTTNVGRYSMLSTNTVPNPLATTIDGAPFSFDLVIYQASGGQLVWLNVDGDSVFLGPLEKQGSLSTLPAVKTSSVKAAKKR